MNNYKIYVHINRINGKLYIGQTSRSLKVRCKNGTNYKTSVFFNNAIQKYGWDNFDHIVLVENLSKEMADIIETELIKKYKTNNPQYGYNISSGGSGSPVIKYKHIYKYDLDGNYLEYIGDITNFDPNIQPAIRQCCDGKIYYAYGFQWKTFKADKIEKIPSKRDIHVKQKVIQTDMEGNIISNFPSIVDASEITGVSVSSISKCCRGKIRHGGGYLWKYA